VFLRHDARQIQQEESHRSRAAVELIPLMDCVKSRTSSFGRNWVARGHHLHRTDCSNHIDASCRCVSYITAPPTYGLYVCVGALFVCVAESCQARNIPEWGTTVFPSHRTAFTSHVIAPPTCASILFVFVCIAESCQARNIPEWGTKIFSPLCVCMRPNTAEELGGFMKYAIALTRAHLMVRSRRVKQLCSCLLQ
jgi:hypothetical protein